MSRDIFIGDIHGCSEEFAELLTRLELKPSDHVVSIGDQIHKGPDSPGVLDIWNNLTVCRKTFILGNHEQKHLQWLERERTRVETGAPNLMCWVEEYPSCLIDDRREDILKDSYIARNVNGLWAVHAGIPANYREPPQELTYSEWRALSSAKRKKQGPVLRVRFLGEGGKMVSASDTEPYHPFWASTYDGRFGPVVFGHMPFQLDRPAVFNHAWGIDLGCVYGGHLCALIVENGQINHLTVKAKRVYQASHYWMYQ